MTTTAVRISLDRLGKESSSISLKKNLDEKGLNKNEGKRSLSENGTNDIEKVAKEVSFFFAHSPPSFPPTPPTVGGLPLRSMTATIGIGWKFRNSASAISIPPLYRPPVTTKTSSSISLFLFKSIDVNRLLW